MHRLGRDAPLPGDMQGRWVDADQATSVLIVQGGEITCFGQIIEYDYKEIDEDDGALTVTLKINNEADEDTFQRTNITGLVMTSYGEFHAYNVKFASRFVRVDS